MKVRLYFLTTPDACSWKLTLDLHTDLSYWFEHKDADAGLCVLEPFLSFGQALRLLDALPGEKSVSKLPAGIAGLEELLRKSGRLYNIKPLKQSEIRLRFLQREQWKREMSRPGPYPDEMVYRQLMRACRGRALFAEEFHRLMEHLKLPPDRHNWASYVQLGLLRGHLRLTNGLSEAKRGAGRWPLFSSRERPRCHRCGSGPERFYWSPCVHCEDQCPYCEECLTMGKSRFCAPLIIGLSPVARGSSAEASENLVVQRLWLDRWGLSEAQYAASLHGLGLMQARRVRQTGTGNRSGSGAVKRGVDSGRSSFLIWAVTGAGKTEMIFPFIEQAIAAGGAALIATPRRDVVLELEPRVRRAFPANSVAALYGGSSQTWEQAQITVATTHQLLRFQEAFDLVILDEIDAFPYHDNPVLEYAVKKACKPDGFFVLLSATPPRRIRKAAERGRLPHVKVPVRYHRKPLPVPRRLPMPQLSQVVRQRRLPKRLRLALQASVDRGAQVFMFVPRIALVEPLLGLIRRELDFRETDADLCTAGTSSKDSERGVKVQQFRSRDIRLLVTTTILERGVTIPKSDVFILDADSASFDEAALIQMAGRAGRSQEDPQGFVFFGAKEATRCQREAIRQIKRMNRIASKKGYLERGAV